MRTRASNKTPVKKPNLKFCRIEEITKSRLKDVYYGVIRSSDDDKVFATVVKSKSDSPWIFSDEFLKKDFEFTDAEKDDVLYFFKKAKVDSEKKMDGAEFDLREAARNLKISNERFGEIFGEGSEG